LWKFLKKSSNNYCFTNKNILTLPVLQHCDASPAWMNMQRFQSKLPGVSQGLNKCNCDGRKHSIQSNHDFRIIHLLSCEIISIHRWMNLPKNNMKFEVNESPQIYNFSHGGGGRLSLFIIDFKIVIIIFEVKGVCPLNSIFFYAMGMGNTLDKIWIYMTGVNWMLWIIIPIKFDTVFLFL